MPSAEYERLCDLLDEYFTEVKRYNLMLGAFDLTPEALADACQREALSYNRVRKAKDKLREQGIAL